MLQVVSIFCALHLVTDSKNLQEIEPVNGASASMINGVCAFGFGMAMPLMLKLLITIRKSIMSISVESLHKIDFSDVADLSEQRQAPIHPGEILLEEWLKPLKISQYALAKAIGVSARRINEIVHGKRAITADTALRLATFFGTDAQSWMNLQAHYDTEIARELMRETLSRIRQYEAIT